VRINGQPNSLRQSSNGPSVARLSMKIEGHRFASLCPPSDMIGLRGHHWNYKSHSSALALQAPIKISGQIFCFQPSGGVPGLRYPIPNRTAQSQARQRPGQDLLDGGAHKLLGCMVSSTENSIRTATQHSRGIPQNRLLPHLLALPPTCLSLFLKPVLKIIGYEDEKYDSEEIVTVDVPVQKNRNARR